ncbi:MAG: MFS transporter [Chloroflexota bacterium]
MRPGAFDKARRVDATLRRNLSIDVASGAGVGLCMALVGVLVPVVARRGGLDAMGLAVLATGPFVANVLALFAGRLGARSPRSLALVRAIGGLALVLMLPLAGAVALAGLVLLFWITVALSAPYQMRLWSAIYPTSVRGRLIGLVGTGRSAAAAIGSLAGGIIADHIGGLQAVALGGVVGMILGSTAVGYLVGTTEEGPAYDLRRSIVALTASPRLVRVTIGQMCLGAGFIAATPLYAFVYVDRLHLSLGEVGLLGILTAGATTVAYLPWGNLADRRGGLRVFQIGSVAGATALFLYAWAPGFAVLGVGAVLVGICNGSVEIGIQAVMSEHVAPSERAAALAAWAAANGVRGIIAPFIATALVTVGLISVQGGILLAALVSTAGALIYAFAGRVPATRAPVPAPAPEPS